VARRPLYEDAAVQEMALFWCDVGIDLPLAKLDQVEEDDRSSVYEALDHHGGEHDQGDGEHSHRRMTLMPSRINTRSPQEVPKFS